MAGLLITRQKGSNQFGEINSLVTINLRAVATITETKLEKADNSNFMIKLISGEVYYVSKEDAERATEYLSK